jgi:DNA-binding response OmpR family regulator
MLPSGTGGEGAIRKTVLVVDDDPDLQQLLRLMLEEEGYRVEIANNGAEAQRWLEQREPDLIVLDLMMPEVNGIQFATRLRETQLGQRVPILVLSAASQVLYKAGWIDADGCLPKPFGVSALLQEVARLTSDSTAAV